MTSTVRRLFGAGTARGGTGLVVQTLRANARIELAMEPFLSVFKHYRSAVHRDLAETLHHQQPGMSDPMASGYFSSEDLAYLDRILGQPVDYDISSDELAEILDGIRGRAGYDAVDLVPHVEAVSGSNYAELIDSAIDMVEVARQRDGLAYCGTLENWCADFFPFLADRFPDARFFLVVRDPRAVVASALNAEPSLRSTLLSYARSIRKNLDLFLHYAGDPRFAGRLCLVKFEALVENPAGISRELCDFLEVDYEPGMIDPANHVVPGSTALRDGVSSFEAQAVGYSPERAVRWKQVLEQPVVDAVGALLYPELVSYGYLERSSVARLDGGALAALLAVPSVNEHFGSWSLERHTASYEYGAELLRIAMWEGRVRPDDPAVGSLLRECFLTERVAENLLTLKSAGGPNGDWRGFDHLLVVR